MKVKEYKGHKVPEGAEEVYFDGKNKPDFYLTTRAGQKLWTICGSVWLVMGDDDLVKGIVPLPEQPTKADNVIEHDNNNKYSRKIKTIVVDGIDHDIYVDVYDVLTAFNTTNKANDHAIKKQLATGQRGVKGVIQDLTEARDSLNRAIEIEKAKGGE